MKTRHSRHALFVLLLALLLLPKPAFCAEKITKHQASSTLTLSDAQKAALKRIRDESAVKAIPAGLRLAAVARQIYENTLADKPSETLRVRLSRQLKKAATELLDIKGKSIRDSVKVLTPKQKQLVRGEMHKPGASADLSEVIAKTFQIENK